MGGLAAEDVDRKLSGDTTRDVLVSHRGTMLIRIAEETGLTPSCQNCKDWTDS
ncbi:hypothetical protein [Rhodococcus sp. ARC_M6]|uniref:hypothetical protein n=1 Tax=Rhodococcus sp. ARC_M6 TaxID=2928852 RepID=UPI001FB25DD7|nr:hypothetical protein [Rhodococcus sp. ARC_M6]MCJ0903117.1 hypothetical protein [Rhodococcus sp. ARC_M6]